MWGRRVGRLILALVAVSAAGIAANAWAVQGPIQIQTAVQCCSYDHVHLEPYFMEAGNVARFHPNVGERHNLTALDLGPDGKPLFRSPTLLGGQSADIAGTQYLQPGGYAFYCTIHGFNVMHGTLVIVPGQPGTVARPAVAVGIVSHRLRQVRRTGLIATVSPSTDSGEIALVAKKGRTVIARRSGIAAAAGETRTLPLYLTAAGRRTLRGLRRAKVTVEGTLPYSLLGSASVTLR